MNDVILVADDDRLEREMARSKIQTTQVLRRGWQVSTTDNINPNAPVVSVAHQIMFPRDKRASVVVLDLGLGRTVVDGLSVIRSLRYAFCGIWILHSNLFFEDQKIHEEALGLGVRFAIPKHSDDVGVIAHAALGLAAQKRIIGGFVQDMQTDGEILDYPQPTDLGELLIRLDQIAHQYNGSNNPISWAEVQATSDELVRHSVALHAFGRECYEKIPKEDRDSREANLLCSHGSSFGGLANFAQMMKWHVDALRPYLVEEYR